MDVVKQQEFNEGEPRAMRRAKVGEFISSHLRIAGRSLSEQAGQMDAMTGFESRPYQQDAWASLWRAREEGATKGLIRFATGLGKTYVAAFDYAKFRAEQADQGHGTRALFVVHQNAILNQASNRFSEVLPTSSRSRFTNSQTHLPASEITFTTFQTLREGAQKFPPAFFDYIIYDEAHHIEADTYKKVVDYFEPRFQLGLTATPNRMDRRDITEHFGEPLYSKTLPEAIQEGYLANVEYSVMFDDAVKRALKEGFQPRNAAEIKALFEVRERNEVIVQKIKDAQEKIRQDEGIKRVKTIIFCENIASTEEFATLLEGQSYHSKLTPSAQDQVFRDFAYGDNESIAVRDMFNEGVDIPDARLMVFLRSTQSKPVFEQQLGRGMRKTDSKSDVTVMDFVANINHLIMLEEFAEVVFKEATEKDFDDPEVADEDTVFSAEYGRFIFDKDVINLIHSYNQLLEKEKRNVWHTISNDELIQLALSISPDKPLTSTDIEDMSRREFPSLPMIYNRFGSMGDFQRACGFEIRDWDIYSDQDIIDLALQLSPHKPLLVREVKDTSEDFPSAHLIRKRFGSWTEFQKACGFDVIDWATVGNEELVARALVISPDKPLTRVDMDILEKNEFPGAGTIANRFGSMLTFHKLCGFETSTRWSEYSSEDILDLARQLSPNKPLTISEVGLLDGTKFPSATYIYEKFGSWVEFQRLCGFTVKTNWANYSNEDIAELAQKISPDAPLDMNGVKALENGSFPSWAFIQKRFKTVGAFQEACGFTPVKKWRDYSNDDIVALALALSPSKPLGMPDAAKLDKYTFPSADIIYSKFGSWVELQRACGFEVQSKPVWSTYTNEDIIGLAKEISPDKPIGQHAINALSRDIFPSYMTIIKRFGSLKDFQIACGFEPIKSW